MNLRKFKLPWTVIISSSLIIAIIYIFMEWLFIATKPSFMTILPFTKKILILLYSISLVSLIMTLPTFILYSFDKMFSKKNLNIFKILAILLQSLEISCIALLIIDNFTYTVFRFGIITSKDVTRGFYSVLFIVMLMLITKRLLIIYNQIYKKFQFPNENYKYKITIILFVVLIPALLVPILYNFVSTPKKYISDQSAVSSTPNILLITADGVNAKNLSAYGNQKDTTPFLKELSKDNLFMENAFTNSANSAGSITSMMTGKYPTDIRVIYPPDILRGKDAYEHLPGILKSLGYHTVQYGQEHYIDANQVNMLNAFDEVNGNPTQNIAPFRKVSLYLPTNFYFFICETGDRLISRLLHIFYIKDMVNTYAQVTTKPETIEDFEKIEKTINLLENTEQPLFVHIHWMGTHGPKFFPSKQIFSDGKIMDNQTKWDVDFYNDSILDFDSALSYLYEELENLNLDDDVMIIIGSDHGFAFQTKTRIPLLVKFPNNDYTGTIKYNVQNLDIAPTILDYIDVEQPDWMVGHSLISENIIENPIISLSVINKIKGESIDYDSITPPFYQFGWIATIICDNYYWLDLSDYNFTISKTDQRVDVCSTQPKADLEVIELLIDHLESYRFDISSLLEHFAIGNID